MEVREARAADVPALMDLYLNHLTAKPPMEPQSPEAWEAKLAEIRDVKGMHVLLGEVEGRAVSSVTLVIIPNLTHNLRPYALIENVVTRAEDRGCGYATAVMARAADIAREAGCYKIMLMTGSKRESTLRFYERCGYNGNDKTGFVLWLGDERRG